MKRTIYSVLLVIFISACIYAQDSFEGKVKIDVTNDGDTESLTYMVKDGKFRFDTGEDAEGIVILDAAGKKMLVIVDEQNMYMEIPMNKMMENMPQTAKEESSNEQMKKTGETREINGYTCEKWEINDESGATEAWLTKDLGGFMFMNNPMGGESKTQWQSGIEGSGLFPMLVIHRDASGNEDTRFEVKSVEKISLSSDLFTPPAGYQKMSIPMME